MHSVIFPWSFKVASGFVDFTVHDTSVECSRGVSSIAVLDCFHLLHAVANILVACQGQLYLLIICGRSLRSVGEQWW